MARVKLFYREVAQYSHEVQRNIVPHFLSLSHEWCSSLPLTLTRVVQRNIVPHFLSLSHEWCSSLPLTLTRVVQRNSVPHFLSLSHEWCSSLPLTLTRVVQRNIDPLVSRSHTSGPHGRSHKRNRHCSVVHLQVFSRPFCHEW